MDVRYFVEGQCEEKLFNELKRHGLILPGKVTVFNALQSRIASRVMTFKSGSIIVFAFDTDKGFSDVLMNNIKTVLTHVSSSKVICFPQVENLEDELTKACSKITDVREITRSKSIKDFKSDFISCNNLYERLLDCRFDLSRIWISELPSAFRTIKQFVLPKNIKILR